MLRSEEVYPQNNFGQYFKNSRRVWLDIAIWLALTAGLLFSLGHLKLSENKRIFFDQASQAFNEVREKISINKTVLEGFASMLRLAGDSPVIRQYTAEMRQAYPHIYSVGFQKYVSASNRDKFEKQQRDIGYKNFRIKDFSYENDRIFHEVSSVPSYYATLFADSGNPEVQKVLGLDQFAVPFLKQALITSIKSGREAATRPFTLAEGGRGYVLYKALETIPDFDPDSGKYYDSTTVSILIKTDTLLSAAGQNMPHAAIKLSYRDIENGEITELLSPDKPTAYTVMSGKMEFQRQLDESGQPFLLSLEVENGFSAWDLALAVCLLCLSVLVIYFYLQHTHRRYLTHIKQEQTLLDLADERKGLEQRAAERTTEINQKAVEIQRLAGKLVNLQEKEYRFIARELHDEFGQVITAIGINTKLMSSRLGTDASATEVSNETLQLIDHLHTSMHSLIGRLRPEALDTFGLKVSIEHCLELFKLTETGIECRLTLDPDIDHLPDNYAITIYRAIQELVNNSVKHGKPELIELHVKLVGSQVSIIVDDDGLGMDVNHPKGYGLTGLNERLLALNGVMIIEGSHSGGCKVTIKVPLLTDRTEYIGHEQNKNNAA